MSYHLFLDDEHSRFKKVARNGGIWIWAQNYEQFIAIINRDGLPKSISFDHDLGTKETGVDCARWLTQYCINNKRRLPICSVHSMNVVGAENIKSILRSFKEHIEPDIVVASQERIIKVNTSQAKNLFVDRLTRLKVHEFFEFGDEFGEIIENLDNKEIIQNQAAKLADLLFGKD